MCDWSNVVKRGKTDGSSDKSSTAGPAPLTDAQQALADAINSCNAEAIEVALKECAGPPSVISGTISNAKLIKLAEAFLLHGEQYNYTVEFLINMMNVSGTVNASDQLVAFANTIGAGWAKVNTNALNPRAVASSASSSSSAPSSPLVLNEDLKCTGVGVLSNVSIVKLNPSKRGENQPVIKPNDRITFKSGEETTTDDVMKFLGKVAKVMDRVIEYNNDEKNAVSYQNSLISCVNQGSEKDGVWPVFFSALSNGELFLLPLCMTSLVINRVEIAKMVDSGNYAAAARLMAATKFARQGINWHTNAPNGPCKLGVGCHNPNCNRDHVIMNEVDVEKIAGRHASTYPAASWMRTLLPDHCGEIPPFRVLLANALNVEGKPRIRGSVDTAISIATPGLLLFTYVLHLVNCPF